MMIHDADLIGLNESRRDWKKVPPRPPAESSPLHLDWAIFVLRVSKTKQKSKVRSAPPPHSLAPHLSLIHNMDHNP